MQNVKNYKAASGRPDSTIGITGDTAQPADNRLQQEVGPAEARHVQGGRADRRETGKVAKASSETIFHF